MTSEELQKGLQLEKKLNTINKSIAFLTELKDTDYYHIEVGAPFYDSVTIQADPETVRGLILLELTRLETDRNTIQKQFENL